MLNQTGGSVNLENLQIHGSEGLCTDDQNFLVFIKDAVSIELANNELKEGNFKIENANQYKMTNNSFEDAYSMTISNSVTQFKGNQFLKKDVDECQPFKLKVSNGEGISMTETRIANGYLELENLVKVSVDGLVADQVVVETI